MNIKSELVLATCGAGLVIKIFIHCRAVKFNRGIRKLGLMPDGVSTYLDQFRMLVGIQEYPNASSMQYN